MNTKMMKYFSKVMATKNEWVIINWDIFTSAV